MCDELLGKQRDATSPRGASRLFHDVGEQRSNGSVLADQDTNGAHRSSSPL
jgi:hypothetical protein